FYISITFPTSRLLALNSSSSLLACSSFLKTFTTLFDSYPGLQFLELLLATLHGEVLSLIQTVLQIFDCDLQVLLHPLQMSTGVLIIKSIIPAPDLRVKSALHGVDHPLAVSLDLLDLLILLCQLPVNLTFHLVELKLNAKNLGFLVLQSALQKIKTNVFKTY
uniref:Uncharacterized protein n=1 Tax=Salarias fasciatus TaxID=181472 RepID=A0A672HNU9_SALFA